MGPVGNDTLLSGNSLLSPAKQEAQGRLTRGFSEPWQFKRSNNKEVNDGAPCRGGVERSGHPQG